MSDILVTIAPAVINLIATSAVTSLTLAPNVVALQATSAPVNLGLTAAPIELTIAPVGAPGAAGLSAYEVAVANGFVGTEAEWLASLVGPAGSGSTTAELYEQSAAFTDIDAQNLPPLYLRRNPLTGRVYLGRVTA